ncbi:MULTISPECIES: SDR family oxidoreductase [Acidobacteriaceae]|uniref:SDR family oxidoreductase n=1 Tax=Acidobacteriaceae TaxID=204434 RepID=UPI00131C17C2|nr:MULTISPECIES: SDR family oxidoreductase [Acidobacteriaceae]MDW5266128.1 SDR family oxidoreductase [Edaphobacter sp.]
MGKLDNKIAVITGGTTGIGLATAQLFIEEGAKVIVTGRNPETLDQARKILGSDADVIAADTSDLKAVQQLFKTIAERYKKIDALFVNAGVAKFAPLAQSTPEFFDEQFSVNVRGAYFTVQHAVPLIADGGAILFTASMVTSIAEPMSSVYSATKAALRSFGRSLASELAPKIRVNTVSPGPIETPIFGKLGLPSEVVQAFAADMLQRNPLKRIGQGHDVAKAALFLLSDQSAYTTGIELFVDGGMASL